METLFGFHQFRGTSERFVQMAQPRTISQLAPQIGALQTLSWLSIEMEQVEARLAVQAIRLSLAPAPRGVSASWQVAT